MVNKRLLDFAKRHKTDENLSVGRSYPTPESYSMPKEVYYGNLGARDTTHPERVENALGCIRTAYRDLREHYGTEKLVVVAVGSSLIHSAYKDIDVFLLGMQNKDFREQLFEKVNDAINGSQQNRPNQNTFFYAAGSLSGPSTSDILPPKDYLIDLILDESGNSFDVWHRMMVNSNQRYCILDRNVEESYKGGSKDA